MRKVCYLWAIALGTLALCLAGCAKRVAGTDFPNTISGVMVDSMDIPVANAMAIIIIPRDPDFMGTDFPAFVFDTVYTGRDGKFRFEDIHAGTYALEGRKGASLIAYVRDLAKGDEELQLDPVVLSRPGSLEGGVDIAEGLDVYSVIKETHFLARTDDRGNFLYPMLPSGKFDMEITIHSQRTGDRKVLSTRPVSIEPSKKTTAAREQVPVESLWAHFKKLNLNTNPGGAGIANNVLDIPILVRLNAANFTFSEAQSDGSDIRIFKSGGAPLPFEIERWDAGQQAAEIWVGMDTVYGARLRQLNMHWGNAYAKNLSGGAAVFDTAHGFAGVWHYGENPGDPPPQMKDATFNGAHGTSRENMPGSSSVEANIGRGLYFDGSGGYISMDGMAPLLKDGDAVTVSTWFKSGKNSLTYFLTGGSGTYDSDVFRLGMEGDGRISVSSHRNKEENGTRGYMDDEWHFVSASFDARGNRKVYVDGVEIPGYAIVDPPPFSSMNNLVSGVEWDKGSKSNTYRGILDEVRISRALRSQDWIKLSYENQKINQTLIEFVE